MFYDKQSGANTNRKALLNLIDYIRDGDIVVVTELDRLGRNNTDLSEFIT
ncbi:recombinase family protein [Facklamia sp. HMSC062C11]